MPNEISASCSIRMNTGNYEGTEFFLSLKKELDDFDDPIKVRLKLQVEVETAMLQQLLHAYKARGKNLSAAQIIKHHGLGFAKAE